MCAVSLCPPCAEESNRWLDYRLPPARMSLSYGIRRPQDIAQAQRLRADEWRDTIRTQQQLIADNCQRNHHADPQGD